MQRTFILNLFFLVFLNLLIKPFWILGINVAVQNEVGPEVYGIYFAMMNFSLLFFILHDLGINNYNNRNVARDPAFLQRHFASMGLMKLALGVLFLTVTWTVGKYVMGYPPYYLFLLSLVGINVVLASVMMFLRSNISGLQLFRLDSIASVLDRALMILFCALLLWGNVVEGPFQIEWFAYAQMASLVLSCSYCIIVILIHAGRIRIHLEWKLFATILKQSFPFALLSLLMSIYNRVDGVMLEKMLEDGTRQAGIYAQAYKFFEAANMVGYMFATLLLPLFSRMISEKEDIRPVVGLATRILFLPAVVLVVAVTLYSTNLMGYLYKAEVEATASVFPWLMCTFIPVALNYVYGSLLTANGSLRVLNVVALIGLILNVTLNYLLIPSMQATGSAIATLVTQTLVVGSMMLVSVRLFDIQWSWSVFGRVALFLVLLLAAGWGIPLIGLSWMVSLILFVLIGGVAAFVLRLVDAKQLVTLFKQRSENSD